jgi:hypothetical protein
MIKINHRVHFWIPVIIVIFGFSIFELRSITGATSLTAIVSDSLEYINLINGGTSSPPFSTRILLIYICKLLPLAPEVSLLVVNSISLLFIILGSTALLSILKFSNEVIVFSVVTASTSFAFAYNFNNPYLTDLPAMALLILFLIALKKEKFNLALISCCISLLFRESIAALVPMFFLFFSFRKSVFASILATVTYVTPKFLIAGGVSHLALQGEINLLYIIKLITSYGILWLTCLFGYLSLRKKISWSFKFELSLLFFSFVGALLSSLHAADITRMYFLMFPTICVGSSFLFERVIKSGGLIHIIIFALLNISLSLCFIPNYFWGSGQFGTFDQYIESNAVKILILISLQSITLYKMLVVKNIK